MLLLALPLLSWFESQLGRPLDVFSVPQYVPANHSRGYMRTLFSALREGYYEGRDARGMMLYSLLRTLLVWLNRQCCPTSPMEDEAEQKHSMMHRLSRLIENYYRQHLPLAECAKLAGLLVTHLNYLYRELYGCSTLGVLHQRLMLEVRRSLQYTRTTVTQLSDYLGFNDAAYFSCFFRRYGGMSPRASREITKDNAL